MVAKPRVIIADCDMDYIFPFQLKFAEDYFEEVDVEIITDAAYYEQVFSVPQQADVLIVSEQLYDISLQRHNIKCIFLMTEHQEDDQTGDLNVNRIFKYTSIKEIINEITAKSGNILSKASNVKKETQVIVVYSAAGGVGKTTVALGISACLAKSFKRVLYIDAERLQTFHGMVENRSPIRESGVYTKLARREQDLYQELKHTIRQESFFYLPPFKTALMSLGLSYSLYASLIREAKKSGDFDFIIVDTDSAFDEDKAQLIDLADRVILVTGQTRAAVVATNILVSNISGSSGEKYVFVCNNFDTTCDNALISQDLVLKFSVGEYINHFEDYDQLKIADFAMDQSMQRAALLVN